MRDGHRCTNREENPPARAAPRNIAAPMRVSLIHDGLRRVLGQRGYGLVHRLARGVKSVLPGYLYRRARFAWWNRGVTDGGEIVLRPDLRLHLHAAGHEDAEWFCFRAADTVAEMDLFLEQTGTRQRLLDVGAFHAIFSLVFARRAGASAVAVEPSPLAFSILAENLRLNPELSVQARRVAAGAARGSVRMGADYHYLRALPPGQADTSAVDIEVWPVDDLCATLGFLPDVVKIDVEGFEREVLRGAQGILRRERPLLFLEVHPRLLSALGHSLGEIFDLLSGLHYEVLDSRQRAISRPRFMALDLVTRVFCRPVS